MKDRNLDDLYRPLALLVPKIITDYELMCPGRSLFVDMTWRSLADQQALWAIGRTVPPIGVYVTMRNGVSDPSFHQNFAPATLVSGKPCSLAVDFFVEVGQKYMSHESFYYPLVTLAIKYGVKSGGDWARSGRVGGDGRYAPDWPHVEWFGPVDYSYLTA